MTNVLLTISYDGTDYAGWQIQKNALTVQECMMKAGAKFLPDGFTVTTASRTDAGVHALGQRALLRTEKEISPQKIMDALNHFLPPDIKVWRAELVEEGFHPRYGAKQKQYLYKVWNSKTEIPLLATDSVLESGRMNLEKMQYIASKMVGIHDFKAFSSAKKTVEDTVREIYRCEVIKVHHPHIPSEVGCSYHIYVEGNGFLYNMVRIIAGCIVKWAVQDLDYKEIDRRLEEAFQTGNRELAAQTMPAKGLTLVEIRY